MMTPIAPFTPVVVPIESASMRLAKDAGAGDDRAMAELLRELQPRIERVVRAVLGRLHTEVEDVVQQAMFGLVRALPSFRGECEPVAFASRVAARTAIAAARRTRAQRARLDDAVDVDMLTGAAQAQHADAERSARLELLRGALSRIPPEQAETLALRIMLGWSLPEVAEAQGVPLNTVRSRLRLAKNALRASIDGDPAASEALSD